ncbi:MAG: CcmD family protein [Bacteroidia bacterium]
MLNLLSSFNEAAVGFLVSEAKFNATATVLVIIMLGLGLYLFRLDRKLSRMEKNQEGRDT